MARTAECSRAADQWMTLTESRLGELKNAGEKR
jgi:hypothetical protein